MKSNQLWAISTWNHHRQPELRWASWQHSQSSHSLRHLRNTKDQLCIYIYKHTIIMCVMYVYIYIYMWDVYIYMIYSFFLTTQRSHQKKNRGPISQRRQRNMRPIDACMCMYIYIHIYYIYIYIPVPNNDLTKKNMFPSWQQSWFPKKTHNKNKKNTTNWNFGTTWYLSHTSKPFQVTKSDPSQPTYHVGQKLWHLSTSKDRSCSSDNSDFKLARSWESEWILWTWWRHKTIKGIWKNGPTPNGKLGF